MAHFYGQIQGNRGMGARCGTKKDGLWANIRGWDVGCVVRCFYDEKTNTDVVKVFATKGSSGNGEEKLIATLYENGEVQFAEALEQNFGVTLHPQQKKKP